MRNKVRHIPAEEGEDAGKPQVFSGRIAAPKERPILFSRPMIPPILADLKQVTRRLSKQWLKVKAGDRLWVRETWWEIPEPSLRQLRDGADTWPKVAYDVDESDISREDNREMGWRLRPSIFMPRWASRILLECEESAQPQRLREISRREAQLEGMESCTPVDQFRVLWNTLHTKPGERWEDNPEVVRVGRFHRVPA